MGEVAVCALNPLPGRWCPHAGLSATPGEVHLTLSSAASPVRSPDCLAGAEPSPRESAPALPCLAWRLRVEARWGTGLS